ncbi:kinase domain protein [Ancylostoma caninum]|uniref:Mitogen-activated protein kinase kinase kinase n=2 Tax=Ancylostoma TaxID=29169 RepID=A0A368GH82_ANCCA|nr:kinase domain protein [Ancylostoma caninum]
MARHEANPDAQRHQNVVAPQGKPLNNNYYRAGIGTLYEGIFACFRPVWGYFGRSNNDLVKSIEDDWEIPFEAITGLEWLGAGSQGAVFRGCLNGQTVAVKKVKLKEETDIKHLRHLNHPNIIKFVGVCTQAPCFCLVMEYCPNGQLGDVLKSDRVIGWQDWCSWSRQIAEGMEYLHKNKVIHRDLKSPNILFDEDGVVKICDFGTSHQQKKQNSTVMSFCGTVSWMAPEVIKKQPCCEKVDVYSYGVVLWELLTREQPYKNINQMAIIYGVGSNNLSLPIPETAPDGLKMLMRQCWSTTPRNRPSFTQCLKYMDILYAEFKEMGDEEFFRRAAKWRADAANIQYPETITKGNAQNFAEREDEKELIRKRREELKHAQDIREMYENKLRRTNKMYSKLTDCMNELLLKEKELEQRIRMLDEQQRYPYLYASTSTRPTVVRAGPRTMRGSEQDIYCTAIDPHSYGMEVSSSEEDLAEYHRGSPYRCSQASSSSGFPSSTSATFSRQSSSRSSAGLARRRDSTLRESPVRGHHSPFSRSPYMRHSSSSQYCSELIRNSPARTSGMSEDSGVQMWNEPPVLPGGQQVVYSQTLFRNVDGRWSDSRIVQRRKPKRSSTFQRDSPARIPQSRSKQQRASYPSPMHLDLESCCDCTNENCCRRQRARSMIHERMAQSPTPYDDPAELNVSNLPQSTSYQEALRQAGDIPSTSSEHRLATVVEPTPSKVMGYTNPMFISPITSYINPLSSPDSPQSPPPPARKQSGQLANVDQNIDLFSSLDSNNPRAKTQTQSDASAENSTDEDKDEENGNVLDSSLDSQKAFSALTKTSSEEDSAEKRRRELIMLTSSSTMASSLERSLEQGAMHSDGLSDKERRVRAVKNTIRGHRRTQSNPQSVVMSIVDETSSETDSDDAVDI